MSAGMFSYIGDLEDLFTQAFRVLRDKGLFAFTADMTEIEGYHLQANDARFHFSKSYPPRTRCAWH